MANLNFNKTIIAGRITHDIELKTTSNGRQYTNFGVAVNRQTKGGETQADFFPVVVWGDRAKFVYDYFHKGSSILVVGSLQNDRYTDREGVERSMTKITASEIQFVDSKGENTKGEGSEVQGVSPDWKDDDLPF